MKSEYAVWRDEITRPKRSIAHRVALWFDRPAQASPHVEPDPDMFRWWSLDELLSPSPRQS